MQSHTCTASGTLSLRCDSVPLEAVGSRSLSCLVHRRPLPVLVSLGYYNIIRSCSPEAVHQKLTSLEAGEWNIQVVKCCYSHAWDCIE